MKPSIRLLLVALCLSISCLAFAQEADSAKQLQEIEVRGYEGDRPLTTVPAAISIGNAESFGRGNGSSLVQGLNVMPGVRMEERSPGSYRLSVRGSSLRAPFGVRNVKVYWNDLPFTDPGGNSYLNLIDPNMIQRAEVIKGPGSSLYGAGNGGVVLFGSLPTQFNHTSFETGLTFGSFGLRRFNAGYYNKDEKGSSAIQFNHQAQDGFRQHSAMRRDVLMINEHLLINTRRTLTLSLLLADIQYQTPGGLTIAEYNKNPRLARPTVGQSFGADTLKAAIYNKTMYLGASHEYQLSNRWSNRTGVYGTATKFENPTVRKVEYERKTEESVGVRSVIKYRGEVLHATFGGEYQLGYTAARTYLNNLGSTGALQTDTETKVETGFLFAQLEVQLPHEFFISAGASYNKMVISLSDFVTAPPRNLHRQIGGVLTPRIALSRKVFGTSSAYIQWSEGYSPPTKDELYPSNKVFNVLLNSEQGRNIELGIKGSLVNESIAYSLAAYDFLSSNTIVLRRDTTGADYFVNAGNTKQWGIEASVQWAKKFSSGFFEQTSISTNYTYNHYRFGDYYKDKTDLSNNQLTGTPSQMLFIVATVESRWGVYLTATVNDVNALPLDDENKTFAKGYTVVGSKFGYRFLRNSNLPLHLFVGVDNLLNQKYSLGNDLNAVNGRYYNAAAPRNFYVGILLNMRRAGTQPKKM